MSPIQVEPSAYDFFNYANVARWIAYWHQIRIALARDVQSVLEVGPGDGTVAACLRNYGLDVFTLDHDPRLRPDVVGDLREIDTIIDSESYDLVLCCEVLEHLPFSDFEPTLAKLIAIARRWIGITLPYDCAAVDIAIRVMKEPPFHLSLVLPTRKEPKLRGEHYWEVGQRGLSLRSIRRLLRRHATLEEDYSIPGNVFQRVFVMNKDRGKTGNVAERSPSNPPQHSLDKEATLSRRGISSVEKGDLTLV